jgi:hypothetical protein
MCARILDFDLEEVLGWAVDLVEGLLTGVGQGREDWSVEARCGGRRCRGGRAG